MQSFQNFQILNEIGDSRKPAKWKWIRFQNDPNATALTGDREARFSVNGDEYIVHVWPYKDHDNKYYVDLAFESVGHSEHITNRGLAVAFVVMATIIDIIKTFFMKMKKISPDTEWTYLTFLSSDWGLPGTFNSKTKEKQRMKLYMAFIKKEFAGNMSKITQSAKKLGYH